MNRLKSNLQDLELNTIIYWQQVITYSHHQEEEENIQSNDNSLN